MGFYDRYNAPQRPPARRPVDDVQQKRGRGVFGLFFNPQIGMSIRPLRETGRMFVHMIALILAQANLLDSRHPAVTNVGGERYSLFEILHIAYQRIEWRQENLVQCSVFVAILGSIVLCGMALFFALFTLLFHAGAHR